MKYIVDRIEGEYAVCEAENKSMVSILLGKLPPSIKEGDHFSIEGDKCTILPSESKSKKRILNLMDDLWKS